MLFLCLTKNEQSELAMTIGELMSVLNANPRDMEVVFKLGWNLSRPVGLVTAETHDQLYPADITAPKNSVVILGDVIDREESHKCKQQ
jgi:hypothetical protein